MLRKSTAGAALLSVMLGLQGCTSSVAVQTHARTAANDSVAKCEAESDAPEECAEHAEIEQEVKAVKANQARFVVR